MDKATAPWLTPAWFQMGLNALKEALDPGSDVKSSAIRFLLDSGMWNGEELTAESAEARYNGNLNPGKKGQFKIVEAWAIQKFTGRHHLFLAMAEDLGYEVRRKPTAEREQELLSKIHECICKHNESIELLGGQLGGLRTSETLRVHPSFRGGDGSFDNGF